jgi:5-methylthioadenosine/S-adenosylhomocysteine deaminase
VDRPEHDGDAVTAASAFVLRGRVVTMDAASTVVDSGAVYVRDGVIEAVAPASADPPPGYEGVPNVATEGTIYPGLIELHNHLSYDALPLWAVPRAFGDRDQWGSGGSNGAVYRQLISGPMTVLGKSADLTAAVCRFVEAKALLGGVTTSQGIALFSNAGIAKYYHGVVRNVEQPFDPQLPGAHDKISDVASQDAALFLDSLARYRCLLLHLAEGTDDAAKEHFEALHLPDGRWAIGPSLAGIHSVGVGADGLQVMADRGASVVWSPLSNLLLYGDTLDIVSAKRIGVRMGIGSDWSPSGSKNLFGELKVARLASEAKGGVFSDEELVAMATRNAAGILGWDAVLGSVEAGKHADLMVLSHATEDPYARLLTSKEEAISLVVIAGVPRFGWPSLMAGLGVGAEGEAWSVGTAERMLNLADPAADPAVAGLTLDAAKDTLAGGLADLATLAADLERGVAPSLALDAAAPGEQHWFLALDHDESEGFAIRPHLPGPGGAPTMLAQPTFTAALAQPLSEVLEPIELDRLTVADDPDFLERIAAEINVWDEVKAGLPALYG